jgi:phosphatidylethanolamine/phosphatidyl-N-methylethanolamine N-methyltransferase
MVEDHPSHRRQRAFRFLRTFLSSPRTVGAILPSSEELAQAMVKGLHLDDGDTLLELGPGTGALTAHIRRILPDLSCYLGIEREPRFIEILGERFPDLRFVQGDAAEAERLLADSGLSPPRVILSGLPFASQKREEQDRILGSIANLLQEGGTFRAFQYMHGYVLPTAVRFRRHTGRLLGSALHLSPPLLSNVPPAYVLTWHRA